MWYVRYLSGSDEPANTISWCITNTESENFKAKFSHVVVCRRSDDTRILMVKSCGVAIFPGNFCKISTSNYFLFSTFSSGVARIFTEKKKPGNVLPTNPILSDSNAIKCTGPAKTTYNPYCYYYHQSTTNVDFTTSINRLLLHFQEL